MSDHAADDAVPEVDESRRKFLIAATVGTGAVGAVLTAVPFVASWNPSESARAAGLPTEVDLSRIEPGQMATFFWRKQQIYIVKRTPETFPQHLGQKSNCSFFVCWPPPCPTRYTCVLIPRI